MICVDTSVWVSAFREPTSRAALLLDDLIEDDEVVLAAPVRAELLMGAPRTAHAALLGRFAAFVQGVPDDDTWTRVEQWVTTAVGAGQRFALSDLLIAATAADHAAAVWSLDADFERMQKLGFVELYTAP